VNKSKLKRSNNRVIAGVCAGLAVWLGWDIALVRLLYLIISIFSAGFPGILAYIILWIVMPEEKDFQS
jgi:phage shock protein PspC (stress-responsive transcriptional regulator)